MMFMAAFLLVVMATLLLRSGNVERNPGPTVIGKRLLLHSSFYRRSHAVNSKTTTCIMKAPKVLNPRPNMNVRFNYPFQSTKISLDTDRTCSFEYSSMRSLISGAHGNQHSP